MWTLQDLNAAAEGVIEILPQSAGEGHGSRSQPFESASEQKAALKGMFTLLVKGEVNRRKLIFFYYWLNSLMRNGS